MRAKIMRFEEINSFDSELVELLENREGGAWVIYAHSENSQIYTSTAHSH